MLCSLNFFLATVVFISLVFNALLLRGLHFPPFTSGIDLGTLSGTPLQHYNIPPRADDAPHRIAKKEPSRGNRYHGDYRVPIIDIQVGDPPQNVTILLDTGWPWHGSSLWETIRSKHPK
jgi:hypothetical protein